MKTTTALATAATIGHAAATFGGFGGFRGANPFRCPSNTDNQCQEKQRGGFDWTDLIPGTVDFDYHGFKFRGFQCKDGNGNGGDNGNNNGGGGGREVEGDCGPDKSTGPSFEYGEGFSVGEMEIFTEFDTDLEFVYQMPDGKECKQRSSCKSRGSTVKNTQCGGATKVVIVHPPQSGKKSTCKLRIPKIKFDCDTATPPKSTPTFTGVPSEPQYTDSETPAGSTPASVPSSVEVPGTTVESSSPETTAESSSPETTEIPSSPETTPAAPESSGDYTGIPTLTAPGESQSAETSSTPGESEPAVSSSPSGEETYVESSEVPGTTQTAEEQPGTTLESASPEQSTPVPNEPITEVITTSHMTTSTIFTTTTSTVTSCAPEVPDCPAGTEGEVVIVTIPVTTTVCPVTETLTLTHEPGSSSSEDSSPESPGTTTAAVPVPAPTTAGSPTTLIPTTLIPATSKPAPPGPQETLPCPEVVPSCLNTWLFSLNCADNTDTSCFCPSPDFVENVFTCIYAHGSTDAIISEAISYLQGICAPHVPENPAIVTCVDSITAVITPPPSPTTPPAGYTTIVVDVTTEVPYVEGGVTITGSSAMTVIKQTASVPNVGFQTNSDGNVGVVPATPAPVVDAPSTFVPFPSGTEDASPGSTTTGPVQAGAEGRVISLLGVGAAFVVGAAVLL